MNTERLHSVLAALQQEYDELGTVGLIQKVVGSLNNVVRQPQENHQRQLASTREKLSNELAGAPSDRFSPAWRQTLVHIGAGDLTGASLKERIDSIFLENTITPAAALAELQEIQKAAQDLKAGVDATLSGFERLGLVPEVLPDGASEIGVLIPRPAVDDQLGELAAEFLEIDYLVSIFSEVMTGRAKRHEHRSRYLVE